MDDELVVVGVSARCRNPFRVLLSTNVFASWRKAVDREPRPQPFGDLQALEGVGIVSLASRSFVKTYERIHHLLIHRARPPCANLSCQSSSDLRKQSRGSPLAGRVATPGWSVMSIAGPAKRCGNWQATAAH